MTYRPKQQTCCAVLTDRSELPWFNNKKQNKKNPKTKQCNSSECVQVRKSQELLTDTLALCEEHLQRASRSVGGARSWTVGRTITKEKEKFNCGGESRVSHTRFTMSHTTQTQTRPLTLTSPLFLTFDWQDAEILGLKHIMAFIQTQGSCGTGGGQGMGARVYMCWLEKSDSQ